MSRPAKQIPSLTHLFIPLIWLCNQKWADPLCLDLPVVQSSSLRLLPPLTSLGLASLDSLDYFWTSVHLIDMHMCTFCSVLFYSVMYFCSFMGFFCVVKKENFQKQYQYKSEQIQNSTTAVGTKSVKVWLHLPHQIFITFTLCNKLEKVT